MDIPNNRPVYVDFLLSFIGTALMAFAIKCIYDPINLVTGGFSGIAIIIKGMTGFLMEGGIPLWLTNMVLNIPLFLSALWLKGYRFIKRSLIATFLLSIWLYIMPEVPFLTEDFLLSALFGGVVSGVGIGCVFISGATTGGTDLLAALIQTRLRHYSIAQIMQVIDALIVLVGAYTFGIRLAIYAIVAIYAVSRVSDGIIEGLKFSKIAYIITNKHLEVSNAILEDLDRGVTSLEARGMYTGTQKGMLFCVVSKKEIVQIKEIVLKVDPDAFVIVSDAREVLGEGFLEVKKENHSRF